MNIQYKIDKLIESKNLDKTSVSKTIGVSRNTVYNLNEKTAIGTIFKICNLLNITLCDLFKEEKIDNLLNKSKLSVVHEEAEVYGEVNYKQKYFETLEKLNAANERLLAYTDLKKELTKKKKI